MPGREQPSLLGTSHFRVLIADTEVGFAEVSRLTAAGDDDVVVLRRALTPSTELYEWRRRVAAGSDDRRAVTIHLLAGAGGDVVTSWRLERAWPRRWSGPSFDAQDHGIAYEEIELSYDELVWLPPAKERR